MDNAKNGKVVTRDPNGRVRVRTYNNEPSKTDQQFKDECNVNNIMAKFKRGGSLNHLQRGPGVYADVSEIPDLLECMEIMTRAQQDFDALPSHIRKRFGNSPTELVDFLNDSKNDDEAIELGFKTRNAQSVALQKAAEEQEKLVKATKQKAKGAGGAPPVHDSTEGE